MPENAHWQVIATGIRRDAIWQVLQKAAEMGGNVRTGLEDTFYLPGGEQAENNGQLIDALVGIVREVGKEPASPEEARQIMGISR